MKKNNEIENNQNATEQAPQPSNQVPPAGAQDGLHSACTTEIAQLKDQLVRVSADFENVKKRIERERGQWIAVAQAELLRSLLPVIDDFDRAMAQKNMPEQSKECTAWVSGVELIVQAFGKFLANAGVQEIVATGVFNPEMHEAVAHVDAPGVTAGQIVSVSQKGYLFKGTVLRPARVAVAR